MALKDLFDMVKADRYTADGREAIIKAQEAETEDKVYQIGEISQKTGLQKTANGWVKPKNGKQPGAKENGPLSPAKRKAERIAKMQEETGKEAPYGRTLKGTPKTPDDNPLTESTQTRAAAESKPDAADQRDKIGGEIKGNLEAAKYYFDKAQSFFLTDPSYKTYMSKAKEYNGKAKAQADDNGFDWEEMHNRGITQAVEEFAIQNKSKATDAYSWIKREAGDSAPRQLTGDTRIRVKKA